MRRLTIAIAEFGGVRAEKYRWWGIAYLIFMFLIIPMAIFLISLASPLAASGFNQQIVDFHEIFNHYHISFKFNAHLRNTNCRKKLLEILQILFAEAENKISTRQRSKFKMLRLYYTISKKLPRSTFCDAIL